MADGIGIKIEGHKELTKQLKELPEKIGKKLAKAAFKKAAALILQSAQSKVPKDSGLLLSSLSIKVSFSKGKITAKVITTDPNAYYKGFVELGTSKMKAQPYLRPALSENEERVLALIVEELNQLVSEWNKEHE